ncbi:MAG: type III pantothenate kinase [Phycisphaerales bacterium]
MGPFIAASFGNTRVHLGRFNDEAFQEDVHLSIGDTPAIVNQVSAWLSDVDGDRVPVVVASVQRSAAARFTSALSDIGSSADVYTAGDDLPIPIGTQLDPETITGVDRLLNAAAAFALLQEACVIVDAGTAMTVDFVDGRGTFHGGAILPGAAMQLKALARYTDALPEISFAPPHGDEAFGRSTSQAMLQGVFYGLRGAVWKLTERYAEAYGAYPRVIATGGDAQLLFEHDDLVDRVVDNLALLGIAECLRATMTPDERASGEDSG